MNNTKTIFENTNNEMEAHAERKHGKNETMERYQRFEAECNVTKEWITNRIESFPDEDGKEMLANCELTEITPTDEYDSGLPVSGLWTFKYPADNDWLKSNEQKMIDCGFRVYKDNDGKYYFGIQGYGYNFLREHWNPLYKARQTKSMLAYQLGKEKAREEAINWQLDSENQNYSYAELYEWYTYFYRLGKRYGLLTEFRENGIIGEDE